MIYLLLLLLPVGMSIWFSWRMYEDPSILARMTFMLPAPLQEVTPTICLMSYLDMTTFSIALVAVLHASDFIAGEQERGMLSLLVSKPLPRWELILGKFFSFLVIFLPLLTCTLLLMVFSIDLIGIGMVETDVLVGFLLAMFFYGIVYTSIATLFSTVTKKASVASLTSIIFLILWMILDFMIIYLPQSTGDFLNHLSLSHHINVALGFISDGKAMLFVKGGIPTDPTFVTFLSSLLTLLFPLSFLPLCLSLIVLQRKDVQSR